MGKSFSGKAKITALGCFTPSSVLTKPDLEKRVDTAEQWIGPRTWNRQRPNDPPAMETAARALEPAPA
ncbi:MAG: 3-oxoacyl-ACP synthase, partial [Acidobacteriota bacterium]